MCLLCMRPPLPVSAGRAPTPCSSAQRVSFPALLAVWFQAFSLFALCPSSPCQSQVRRGAWQGSAWCGGHAGWPERSAFTEQPRALLGRADSSRAPLRVQFPVSRCPCAC